MDAQEETIKKKYQLGEIPGLRILGWSANHQNRPLKKKMTQLPSNKQPKREDQGAGNMDSFDNLQNGQPFPITQTPSYLSSL